MRFKYFCLGVSEADARNDLADPSVFLAAEHWDRVEQAQLQADKSEQQGSGLRHFNSNM